MLSKLCWDITAAAFRELDLADLVSRTAASVAALPLQSLTRYALFLQLPWPLPTHPISAALGWDRKINTKAGPSPRLWVRKHGLCYLHFSSSI